MESFARMNTGDCGGDGRCGDSAGKGLGYNGGRFGSGLGGVEDLASRRLRGRYAGGAALGRRGAGEEGRG